ncbi:unnamed protein product [Leptosia nina]|uniref:Ig-like domain-containing protein n=1 Tax=Leptosia nina TaxID=320188 RepID=A0AAV1JL63_9NEOP
MLNLVSLLVTAALVSLQCYEANALIERPKIISNNNLESNEIPVPRRKTIPKYVKISQPPPQTVKHEPGAPLVLQCEVAGKPAPVVNWLKNGLPITDFEEDSNEIFSSHPISVARMMSKLVIPSPSNGDVYTCVGTAGVYEKTASTTVLTDEASEDILSILELPTPPLITAYFKDILQVQGSSTTLPCRSYSTSNSKVYWLDNNENVVYGNQKLKVLPSGDLHINNLNFDDMGVYTCTVKNMYGSDSATTFLYPHLP